MRIKFLQYITFLTAIAGIIFLSAAAMPKDDPEPKNLKVLPKNIPSRMLDSVMESYNVALGVDCNYCHASAADGKSLNFASDAKHEKEMARNMIRMTEKLNKQYFEHSETAYGVSMIAVSCYSCHRGEDEPAIMPSKKSKN